jgi:molybdate/tungstate transport system substrate-binding protein
MTLRARRAGNFAALVAAVAVGVAALAGVGCGGTDQASREVRLIYAGSLIVPFEKLAEAFEAQNPGVRVITESHGSVQVLRYVSELGKPFDLAVTADEQLVEPLLFDRVDPDTGAPYADWYVAFATNRLVLALSPSTELNGRIDGTNWPRLIRDPGVRFGLADPRFDAAGYRALMALVLAEDVYDDPFLFEDMTLGRFRTPITAEPEGGVTVIHVPEILEPQPGAPLAVRGSSIQLLALLESGDVDCAFEYESVARQHGLAYVELPPEVDLSRDDLADHYASVVVRLDFRRFASVRPEFAGAPIRYAFTIPASAPEPELAAQFAAFVLSRDGRKVLAETRQPTLSPPRLEGDGDVPREVKQACGRSG